MRAWIISPGKNSGLWEICVAQQCVALGWLSRTDLRNLRTVDEIRRTLQALGKSPDVAQSIWNFVHGMRPGDVVVTHSGARGLVGIGVVAGDYLAPGDPDNPAPRTKYPHGRRVEWRVRQRAELPSPRFLADIVAALEPTQWEEIRTTYLRAHPDLRPFFESVEGTSAGAAPSSCAALEELMALASRTRNLLLCGPPGTGKTFLARRFALAFTDADKVEFVTFHQSFAYEEFIEGLRPLAGPDGRVRYEVVDGVFKRLCRRAQADPAGRYLLVVDEINRANVAKVLGELITLLEDDKRLGQENALMVTLPSSGQAFGVPANLHVLGTMNTADRSIALLDLALRRRFAFLELAPDPSLLPVIGGIDLAVLLRRLNERIAVLLDREHQLGHSHFLVKDGAELGFAWYHRVLPLLGEYFHNDGERLRAVLGSDFVRACNVGADTRTALGYLYDPESPPYEIARLDGDDFLTALRRLAAGAADRAEA